MNNIKIRSFDVFDTCLLRCCGSSHQLFYLLALNILGHNTEQSKLYDFIKIRINAENEAYKCSKLEEITIEDIYDYCNFSDYTSINKEEILKKELELEKNTLIPVYSIVKLINKLRFEGCQIIFISDTYLDYSFIYNILHKYKILKSNDKLYVSSKEKLTKSSGNIYKHIALKNNYGYRNWNHYGDNKISDIKNPKKFGIKSILVKHEFSFYENIGLNSGFNIDYIKNNILMSLSKAIRLNFIKDIKIQFATDLIGPILVPFAYFILSESRKKNIKKIFFIARDGQIIFEIAKIFKNIIFKEIELHLLFLSRSSLYVAEYEHINIENLERLLIDILKKNRSQENFISCFQDFFPNEICNKIIDIIPSLKKINSSPLAIKSILNSKEAVDILINYCIKQRTNILKYLKQKGATIENKKEKCGIVDIRGTRKSEKIINDILKNNNFNTLYGFYLEVFNNRYLYTNNNKYNAIIFEEFKENSYFAKFQELSSVIENYICVSNLNHTINHEEIKHKIKPIFNTEQQNTSARLFKTHLKVLKTYTLHYINNYLFLFNDYNIKVGVDILTDFSFSPNPKYLKAIDKIEGADSHVEVKYIISSKKKDKIVWDRGSFYLRLYNILNILNRINKKLFSIIKRF